MLMKNPAHHLVSLLTTGAVARANRFAIIRRGRIEKP